MTHVDHLVTSGTFSLDGGSWDVDNNVWLVGDGKQCVVIDAPHDAAAIHTALAGRQLTAILLTHAHDDHINAATELADATQAPIWLHPADLELWSRTHPDRAPDVEITDGLEITVGTETLRAVHTPGHTWGSVSYVSQTLDCVFTGDTLFAGGPGATGRSYSDFATIINSIKTSLLTLPPHTVVHTGHGADTTVTTEAPHLQSWIDRGH